ncbi:hypothetical protein VNO77_09400 [Canavalia gladiata]|uniref:BURP domain-containing protein n=1 Tax=Canavalia gladiata TaxID=3824 RepID=A0AAN9R1F3_CANGL
MISTSLTLKIIKLANVKKLVSILLYINVGGFTRTGLIQKITDDEEKDRLINSGQSVDKKSENPIPIIYGIKKSQSIIMDDMKKSESAHKIHSENPIPIIYGIKNSHPIINDDMKKSESAHKIHSENPIPIIYGIKNSHPIIKDDMKKSESAHKIHSENPIPIIYGIKKSQPIIMDDMKKSESAHKIYSENPIPIIYGIKKSESYENNLLRDNMNTHSIIDANGLIPKISTVSHNHPEGHIHLFFLEEDLRPGAKLDSNFNKREGKTLFLSQEDAEHIPFSSEKMKEILEILSVEPGSEIAEDVEKALWNCEVPALNGEEKHCATSLESMVDFITSKIGKDARAMSTEVERETESERFLVKDGVKKLTYENYIICHPLNYPYAVFYCHHIVDTTAHFVPLENKS